MGNNLILLPFQHVCLIMSSYVSSSCLVSIGHPKHDPNFVLFFNFNLFKSS